MRERNAATKPEAFEASYKDRSACAHPLERACSTLYEYKCMPWDEHIRDKGEKREKDAGNGTAWRTGMAPEPSRIRGSMRRTYSVRTRNS